MLKKILFLLSALFFCINVFSSEIIQQKSAWLNSNIPQEIEREILSYCDLADLNNLYQAYKPINGIDTLICPTHKEEKHQCSSIHLSHLSNDKDRCTYILHCIANQINLTNSVKFNSKSEENMFCMIYSLHKETREQLIKETHKNLEQELFSNKIRRRYYQYTELNTKDMLLKAIEQKKFIRVKQILQSPNQYIKKIITTIDYSLSNIINDILKPTKDIIDIQNIIELLLSADNNTNTTQQHDLWQEIVLTVYQKKNHHKENLIKFLLSDKFDYLNPSFSADFYTKENGFLFFCNENDFNLISKRCNKDAIFDHNKIRCVNKMCSIIDFKFSITIVEWLISQKRKCSIYYGEGIKKAYEIGNIDLFKFLIQQNKPDDNIFSKICEKDDTEIITWILDNKSNIYKNINEYYDNYIIHAACKTLSVEIVKLLFAKKIPINYYRNYAQYASRPCQLSTLFATLIRGHKRYNTEENIKRIRTILNLFLSNGLDLDKECCNKKTYKKQMEKYDYLKQLLPCPSLIENENPTEQSKIEETPIKDTSLCPNPTKMEFFGRKIISAVQTFFEGVLICSTMMALVHLLSCVTSFIFNQL